MPSFNIFLSFWSIVISSSFMQIWVTDTQFKIKYSTCQISNILLPPVENTNNSFYFSIIDSCYNQLQLNQQVHVKQTNTQTILFSSGPLEISTKFKMNHLFVIWAQHLPRVSVFNFFLSFHRFNLDFCLFVCINSMLYHQVFLKV